jgi:hypothetical protein
LVETATIAQKRPVFGLSSNLAMLYLLGLVSFERVKPGAVYFLFEKSLQSLENGLCFVFSAFLVYLVTYSGHRANKPLLPAPGGPCGPAWLAFNRRF